MRIQANKDRCTANKFRPSLFYTISSLLPFPVLSPLDFLCSILLPLNYFPLHLFHLPFLLRRSALAAPYISLMVNVKYIETKQKDVPRRPALASSYVSTMVGVTHIETENRSTHLNITNNEVPQDLPRFQGEAFLQFVDGRHGDAEDGGGDKIVFVLVVGSACVM